MPQARVIGLRLLAALLSLAVGLGAAAPTPLPPAQAPDLAYIPADAPAFASVRVSRLLTHLKVERILRVTHPQLAAIQKQFGIPLASIKRMTVVFATEPEGNVFIIHTTKAINRKAVLGAVVPEARKTKHDGLVVYTGPNNGGTVHFASQRLVLLAEAHASLVGILDRIARPATPRPGFREALDDAMQHDMVAWGDVSKLLPKKQGELASLLVDGTQSGKIVVDFGARIEVKGYAYFQDEASAKQGAARGTLGMDTLRGGLLLTSMWSLLGDLPGNRETDRELADLTTLWKLARKAEKTLSRVRLVAVDKTLPLQMSLPISSRDIRSGFRCFKNLTKGQANLAPLFGMSCVPAKKTDSFVAPTTAPSPTYTEPIPGPPPAAAVPAPAVPAPAPSVPIKLTVANVRTTDALLCAINDKGDLVFKCALRAGTAVDVDSTSGQRWAAVFGRDEEAVNFTAGDKDGTWLIRPAPATPMNATLSPTR